MEQRGGVKSLRHDPQWMCGLPRHAGWERGPEGLADLSGSAAWLSGDEEGPLSERCGANGPDEWVRGSRLVQASCSSTPQRPSQQMLAHVITYLITISPHLRGVSSESVTGVCRKSYLVCFGPRIKQTDKPFILFISVPKQERLILRTQWGMFLVAAKRNHLLKTVHRNERPTLICSFC